MLNKLKGFFKRNTPQEGGNINMPAKKASTAKVQKPVEEAKAARVCSNCGGTSFNEVAPKQNKCTECGLVMEDE